MRRIHSLELRQLKALAHPLRLRILEALVEQPRTTKQVAEILGEDSLKLYYHVDELEKAGLIKLVETRTKGNLLEKYYQSVAQEFAASFPLGRSLSEEEAGTMAEMIERLLKEVQEELQRSPFSTDHPPLAQHLHICVDAEELPRLMQQIQALVEQVAAADQEPGRGESSYSFTVLFFPLRAEEGDR